MKYAQEFIYTDLAKASLGHTEPYNLFGVVIDSTFPYSREAKFNPNFKQKDNKPNLRWMVNMKMIDPSLNMKAAQILKEFESGSEANSKSYQKNKSSSGLNYRYSNTYANVTFFGNEDTDMPRVARVGDILRIQATNCIEFKG